MPRNQFTTHCPTIFNDRGTVEHNVQNVTVSCIEQGDNSYLIRFTAICYNTVGDNLVRFCDKSQAFQLHVIDHDHKEEVKMIFPVSCEETLNFNNGFLAKALMTDTANFVGFQVINEYEDSSQAHYIQVHKRFLDVKLIDMSTNATVHKFWIGDLVEIPPTTLRKLLEDDTY